MESDLAVSRNVNAKLVERLVVTERKYWVNEQYLRRECLEISGIPESVTDNSFADKIQAVSRGINVEVDSENVESYHRLKGKESKWSVILKLSKRKDAKK